MSKRGKRSKEAIERRRQERQILLSKHEQAISLVLRYSWRDQENGEVVWTDQKCKKGDVTISFKDFLYIKFKEHFGDGYSFPFHDFGDVLNRFMLSAPPVHSYVYDKYRGAFQ